MTCRVFIVAPDDPWALASSYARAFKELNCQTFTFDLRPALWKHVRGGRVGRYLAEFVQIEPWIQKANLELFRYACTVHPDLVLIIGGRMVRPGSLVQIKISTGALVFNIFPDTVHNLDGYLVASLPLYDHFFTHCKAAIPYLEALRCQVPEYLPLAADPTLHYPVQLSPGEVDTYRADVTFIGNWRKGRERMLEALHDFDLAIWGASYWRTHTKFESPLRKRWRGRPLYGKEYAKACAASKIVLNIIDPLNWPGHNMRLFETPACKVFALVTRTPEVTELFTEGQNIACFGTIEELRERVAYYLEHDEERCRIAEAGYRHVVESGHTYLDRARQILAVFEDASARMGDFPRG